MPEGLIGAFAEHVIYMHPGAPLVWGREAARALLAADTAAAQRPLQWQAIRADLSKDGSMGYTYGFTVMGAAARVGPDGSSIEKGLTLRFGRYISVWTKWPKGKWQRAAHVQIGAPVSEGVSWPDLSDGWEGVVNGDSAAGAHSISLRDELLQADREFARVSSERGAAEAFARYAAPEATMFSASGEIVRGPREIRELFADMPPDAALLWQPIDAQGWLSGDLGYTVGVAEFRNVAGDDGPPVIYTKYLTVWKRQPDGSWKFVVDGGNRRPPGDELESTRP
jgi:ketosteroid isomerase-like protein